MQHLRLLAESEANRRGAEDAEDREGKRKDGKRLIIFRISLCSLAPLRLCGSPRFPSCPCIMPLLNATCNAARVGEVWRRFPEDFVWGTVTSAYQTEGAVREDGRGETIWDRFTHTPGMVRDGSTGDLACDSYHRYRDDIDLMRRIGVNAYRFSVAWSRIYPEGYGRLNGAGLDHYERVVDALLAADIAPYITLYHGDLPQAMQDRGGWANRDTISAFMEYADTLSRRLGDRVTQWVTHNEPWHVAYHGHVTGENAPGLRSWKTGLQVAHNLLVSHGEAVPILRANGGAATQVGIAIGVTPCYPATDREADYAAAVRYDGFVNRWYLDPLFRGAYPDDIMELFAADAPEVQPNGHGENRHADRLPRRQLRHPRRRSATILPRRSWRARRTRGRAIRDREHRRTVRCPDARAAGLCAARPAHHRQWRAGQRRAGRARRHSRPRPARLPPRPLPADAPRHRCGRAPARLLPLDLDGLVSPSPAATAPASASPTPTSPPKPAPSRRAATGMPASSPRARCAMRKSDCYGASHEPTGTRVEIIP